MEPAGPPLLYLEVSPPQDGERPAQTHTTGASTTSSVDLFPPSL
ncbi:hypothetical protein EmuJ_000005300 [Echinococcus multilocularis]|uniref:Uncharacterized protein n=1 Tax=Echinococcus multilocularis TaxID=6211 RepID=A0A087VWG3_ECHMU|nr:hypothetical protein EmuJ_000005300 [Echinococcus multilocularis]